MRPNSILELAFRYFNIVRQNATEEGLRQNRLERMAFWSMVGTLAQGSFAVAAFILSGFALWIASNYRSDGVAPLLEPYVDKVHLEIGFENHGVGAALILRTSVTDGATKIEIQERTVPTETVNALNNASIRFANSMVSYAQARASTDTQLDTLSRFPLPGDAVAPTGRYKIVQSTEIARNEFLTSISSKRAKNDFYTAFGMRVGDQVDVGVCYCSIFGDRCRIVHFMPSKYDGPVKSCTK